MRERREATSIPKVALAGYTNAGKSTLLNALTGAEVSVRDRLFQTLDPTTRTFEHHGREYLLTDTVGFIEKLPHQLVEAFKATLEETILADLIIHVVDASAPEERREIEMSAVDSVLGELGAGDQPRLVVYNKADLLDEDERATLMVGSGDAVLVSALEGEGLDELRDTIETAFADTLRPLELLIPYREGGRLHELHELAGEIEREDREDGVLVRALVPAAEAHRFADLEVNGASPERGQLSWRSRSACWSRTPCCPAAPTKTTRGSISTLPRTPASARASATAWGPASPWRSRPATRASSCRARGWPTATGSPSSTAPA